MIQNQPTRRARAVRSVGVVATGAAAVAGVLVEGSPAASAAPAGCSDVQVVYARGTGERAGLGSTGTPFVNSLTSSLTGKSVSSYAVVYAASADQSSAGAGSTDLTNHVSSTAASCPATKFVLGGYSQGATVVDKSIGLRTASGGSGGTVLPAALAPKIAAIVVFGNPLGIQRQTIETASATYGARAKSFCNTGDPVCGNGNNFAAHLQYVSNGSTTQGAKLAASKITG